MAGTRPDAERTQAAFCPLRRCLRLGALAETRMCELRAERSEGISELMPDGNRLRKQRCFRGGLG